MADQYKDIDVIDMFKSLFKLWWLLLLFGLIGASASFYNAKYRLEPLYLGQTVMFIGKDPNSIGEFNYKNLQIGESLIVDYIELISTRQVGNAVIEKLDLDITLEELNEKVSVDAMEDSRFLTILVLDEDPYVAADIANAVSEILTVRVVELIGIKNIQIIDHAIPMLEKVSPSVARDTVVGGFVGGVFAIMILFIRYTLDNKIRSTEEVEAISGVSIIGSTLYEKNVKLITEESDKRALAHEQYSIIKTNLHFMEVDTKNKVFLMVSSKRNEGKSMTISNLALEFAESGYSTLLIDCDFKKPSIHTLFGFKNGVGLSNLIVDNLELPQVLEEHPFNQNLKIVTSGPMLSDSIKLLDSQTMKDFIGKVKLEYDIVLMDSSPLNLVSDALILSTLSDAVICIASTKTSKKDDFHEMFKTLRKVSSNVVGIIMTMEKNELKT
ncbi:MAG: polysaccharide biosynthesis tyrosine autokinase [Clostridiales bacterium]|nr:polysaccharide biosynthesis tyrosine autokinase [Clostridiales bacterium]